MNSYISMIEDELPGSTPKEQYEYLQQLKCDLMDASVKIKSLEPLIDGLIATDDDARLGHLRVFIERMHEIIYR